MKTKFFAGTLLATSLVMATGCASVVHQAAMRGQILDVTDGETYLCIGSHDGAQVGQELTVQRFTRISGVKGSWNFRKDATGIVKITEIVDEHFAKAKILTGKVGVNDIVELEKH
ncbi:MAG: hypothetical protein WCP34_00245 [Pseudomonadota bacterium]